MIYDNWLCNFFQFTGEHYNLNQVAQSWESLKHIASTEHTLAENTRKFWESCPPKFAVSWKLFLIFLLSYLCDCSYIKVLKVCDFIFAVCRGSLYILHNLSRPSGNIDSLVQDCSNSSALAMELLQSWTEP